MASRATHGVADHHHAVTKETHREDALLAVVSPIVLNLQRESLQDHTRILEVESALGESPFALSGIVRDQHDINVYTLLSLRKPNRRPGTQAAQRRVKSPSREARQEIGGPCSAVGLNAWLEVRLKTVYSIALPSGTSRLSAARQASSTETLQVTGAAGRSRGTQLSRQESPPKHTVRAHFLAQRNQDIHAARSTAAPSAEAQ